MVNAHVTKTVSAETQFELSGSFEGVLPQGVQSDDRVAEDISKAIHSRLCIIGHLLSLLAKNGATSHWQEFDVSLVLLAQTLELKGLTGAIDAIETGNGKRTQKEG